MNVYFGAGHAERQSFKARLAAALERLELRNFPFRLDLIPHDSGLSIAAHVPERDTGEPSVMRHRTGLSLWRDRDDPSIGANGDDEATFRYIRRKIIDVLTHELDECFYVDGVRRYDPHARK